MTDDVDPASPPRALRNAIGVMVGRFPRIDQAFVLREINELERQGQPVILIPLCRSSEEIFHDEARPWLKQAFSVPFVSVRVAWANLVTLLGAPLRYCRLLLRLVLGTVINPSILIRTLVLFPKSVYLARKLPKMGIRHVHAHYATHPTTMAYIVSELSEITFSFTVHGPDVYPHRLLLREKIAAASFVRAVSIFNQAFITGLYPELSRDKIQVGHIGLNPEVYAKAASEHGGESRPLQILSIGALTPSRGFPFLIEAVSRLKQAGHVVQLTIVGDGRLRAAIQQLIGRLNLGDSVRILGAQRQSQVTQLMASTDIFVLPSVIAIDGQMDCMPVSIMEAMAAGKPVVAAAISGIPELVRDGRTGLLVDATHDVRIAEVVGRLADDPALRESLGREAQARIRAEFDVRHTTATLLELLDRRASRPVPEDARPAILEVDWPDLHRSAVGIRHLRERSDSIVAELLVADGITKREIVLKQHRFHGSESRSAQDRARREHGVLTLLGASMAGEDSSPGARFSVPRILAFDDARATIVMERAPGHSLERLIREHRLTSLLALVLPIRKAALWLRRMHERTAIEEDGRYILTAVVLLALEDLDLAAAGERSIRLRRDEIRRTLRSLESTLAEKTLQVSGHHGDYWPGNIFFGDRGVEVIDFEGFREGLPMEDVAQFLVHLELYFAYPFLAGRLERLTSAFLSSYVAGGEPADRDALRLFTLTNALHFLARRDRPSRGPLRDHWRRITLTNLVTRNARWGLAEWSAARFGDGFAR